MRRALPARPRVEIRVRGFALQAAVPVEEIVRAVEGLPQFHLEGLREIVYSPGEPLYYPSLGQPLTASAEYVQAERTIFVYRTDDPLFWHVLYHEIGHHVFFLIVSSGVKKRWVTEIYPRSRCPTPYGEAGAAEDFAECYALYASRAGILEGFPEKLGFLRDWVFSGRPDSLKERAGATQPSPRPPRS
jgi:hypothetical protein